MCIGGGDAHAVRIPAYATCRVWARWSGELLLEVRVGKRVYGRAPSFVWHWVGIASEERVHSTHGQGRLEGTTATMATQAITVSLADAPLGGVASGPWRPFGVP